MRVGYYRTWHIFHLIMTVLTYGYWIIIWVFCILHNAWRNSRPKMQIDREILYQQNAIRKELEKQNNGEGYYRYGRR